VRVAAGALLLLSLGGGDPGPALERLRSLYLAAVEDERAVEAGLREAARLRARPSGEAPGREAAKVEAYRGALVTLRAKHALWPPTRLRHLDEGLAVLVSVVAAHPDVAEIRSLRLMSCFYLPSLLGRKWSVREDFAALARLLPDAREGYPPEGYRAIVAFVLAEGDPGPAERERLERALEEGDG